MKRSIKILALGFAATLAFAATASAQDTDLKFALDWKFEGPSAPYLLAAENGYYADAGLNVTIDSGQGSLEAIPRVASGTYQMGFADINSLIKFKDQNPDLDVKAVMMVYNAPPFAIISLKGSGIESPKDLEGKTLGAPAPDGAYAQWAAFVKANDIDASTVTIENVGFPVREPMLASGQVDAITGFSFSSFLNLKNAGVADEDISVMLLTDNGLDLYGNAIIVNPDFAAENPEAVTAFLAATIKGLKDAIANPAAGAAAVVARNDVARPEIEQERLKMAIRDNFITDEVRTNGFGAIDEARFARSIEQIADTYEFQTEVTVADVFTSEFLPPMAERAVD